jgi:hypothetical protein
MLEHVITKSKQDEFLGNKMFTNNELLLVGESN